MKLVVSNGESISGIDKPVPQGLVAEFGAAVLGGNLTPGGEMKLHLLIPFAQVPNVQPIFKHVGGVMFKVTVERVTVDEMPEGGW